MRIFLKKVLGLCFFALLLLLPKIYCVSNKCAITYVLNGGRFGDNLLNYSKAKWLAYKNNIPLFYLPFKYSDSLKICELEKVYNKNIEKFYGEIVKFYADTQFKLNPKDAAVVNVNNSCLYISNYYAIIGIDWNDKGFISELKKTISPRVEVAKLDLPKDRVSVALHVRKGGGVDNPLFSDPDAKSDVKKFKGFSDKDYPIKFPPDSYYIEQIKKLYEILDRSPLYIYLFTDDPFPLRLIGKYKQLLEGLDIEFVCRESGNAHNRNVVEDFFTMVQFDCLIRNGSNFSFMVDVIGDFRIVIALEKAHWEGDNWVADKIDVKVR